MNLLEFMNAIELLAIRSDLYIGFQHAPIGCGWSLTTHPRGIGFIRTLNTTLPCLAKVDDFEPFYNKIEAEVKHLSPVHMED